MGEAGRTALLARALAGTVDAHPALNDLRVLRHDALRLDELVASIDAHGREEVAAAIDALIGAVRDMLTGLVGAAHGNATDRRRQQSSVAWSPRAMTTRTLSIIRNVATGVPGLDAVLGGGLCEFSFNLIAGPPGSGKTTLVQQILFANATAERTAYLLHGPRRTDVEDDPIPATVHFLRCRQSAFGDSVREPRSGGRRRRPRCHLQARIVAEVTERQPAFVAVDSFLTIGGHLAPGADRSAPALADFIQRLALLLTSWEVTSFLIGEYSEHRGAAPHLHGRGQHSLARGGGRSQLRGPQAPRDEGPRPRANPGPAHVSHRRAAESKSSRGSPSSNTTGLRDPPSASAPECPGSTR